MVSTIKNYSDSEIIAMMEENNSLAWEALYDRYAAAMYGMICSLSNDLEMAEKILIDVFVKLKENQLLASIKIGLCANLLRFTYAHTIKQLGQSGLAPNAINSIEEVNIIRLLCTHCCNLKEVALILNQSEEELRKKLRAEFLNVRNATTYKNNSTKQPTIISF